MHIINEDLILAEPIPFLSKNGVAVHVLRLDRADPVVSGNKWFKLRYHLERAKASRCDAVVTFGGAFSNHIVATAAACAALSITSIGIIRGEAPPTLSHSLQTAASFGMQLFFVSREAYRAKKIPPQLVSANNYFIPEGGYSEEGAAGAATIPYDKTQYNLIACAVGTGTMMAGLLNAKQESSAILGFSALKNYFNLDGEVRRLLKDKHEPVHINHSYHFGGYAKKTPALIHFMNEFYQQTGIPTDFVYTGKLFFGINDLIEKKHFASGTKILVIHSGGLQGNLSLRKGTLIF
ncbi:1-aminocyclopropane-1-carboxylate deaminase/D-cysteine desulfhydrase [Niabella insulamsoli]|uniref:1-aminocyclopropane-1-carboxylate deaminase/D-cysteine desulfhydrase n=1 Tax=Niabella insulamsoli TaxID=3144874 RepID=UPI0031FD6ADD